MPWIIEYSDGAGGSDCGADVYARKADAVAEATASLNNGVFPWADRARVYPVTRNLESLPDQTSAVLIGDEVT